MRLLAPKTRARPRPALDVKSQREPQDSVLPVDDVILADWRRRRSGDPFAVRRRCRAIRSDRCRAADTRRSLRNRGPRESHLPERGMSSLSHQASFAIAAPSDTTTTMTSTSSKSIGASRCLVPLRRKNANTKSRGPSQRQGNCKNSSFGSSRQKITLAREHEKYRERRRAREAPTRHPAIRGGGARQKRQLSRRRGSPPTPRAETFQLKKINSGSPLCVKRKFCAGCSVSAMAW